MRLPLIVLISAYAVATVGYTLIPGYDEQGNVWRMNFLDAFYVVSYTGSTIGFGEIPHSFSEAQRLWTLICIYMTVFAWLFAIGSLVGLVRDDAFHEALGRRRLRRTIRSIQSPFYLICGYGGAGRMLVDNLVRSGRRVVVVDESPEALRDLQLRDYQIVVPGFQMDASVPDNLLKAGLQNRWCAGLLALTDRDETNLKIALAGRLLNQKLSVAARADSDATIRNMASFETSFVIQPSEEFARRAALAITRPQAFRLYERLSEAGVRQEWPEDVRLEGTWLVCGQDDFGRKLAQRLSSADVAIRVISEVEEDEEGHDRVVGPSSEAETLRRAGVESVTGLVAAHESDAENLSTIMTALMINPDLLIVSRENHLHNRQLFEEAGVQLVCSISGTVASAMRPVLETPMVPTFMAHMLERDESYNADCLKLLEQRLGDERVEFWSSRVSDKRAPPLAVAIERGHTVTAGILTLDPRDRSQRLDAIVLMILRDEQVILLPDDNEPLAMGDRILFCGTPHSASLIWAIAVDHDVVRYLRTGEPRSSGWPRRRRAADT